jgi:hypothetical protein
MNPSTILNLPFIQVALPIMLTFAAAAWWNNKRLDDLRNDMNRRFDEIIKRLDRIDATLNNYGERIVRLEERTSPVVRH